MGETAGERVRLAILGGRGGGELVAATARRQFGARLELAGYLNDREPAGATIGAAAVIGPFAAWRDLPADVVFAAPLHAFGDMPARAERIAGLEVADARWLTVADPSAVVLGEVAIGPGGFLGAHAVVKPRVRLGAQVTVRELAAVGHDTEVGDFAFIGAGAIVSGYCRIGRGAYLAPGVVVRDRIAIGAFAVVGIGAVVTRDVSDGAMVAGNPARVVPRG